MGPQASSEGPLSAIGQVAITVRQLARAIEFYKSALGLKFLFEAGSTAFFECGGTRLMLSFSDQVDSTYSSIVYYQTANIEATTRLFRERGVEFEAPPRMIAKMPDHELWMAFFRDSEGNLVGLMSEVR